MNLLNFLSARGKETLLPEKSKRPQKVQYVPQVWSDVYKNSTRARKLQAEGAFSGRFFRRILRMRRDFLTPCTIKRTQGKKLLADGGLCGRSMVEMLGVLAIIGVLSVGAIAGYQKAMMKYKLNKQAQQISSLLNGMMQEFRNLDFSAKNVSGNSIYLHSMADKLNIIPQEMKVKHGSTFGLRDPLGNSISIYWEKAGYVSPYFDGFFNMSINGPDLLSLDEDGCRNIWNLAKEMSGSLWRTNIAVGIDRPSYHSIAYFGDSECSPDSDTKPCLKDLTVLQIQKLCTNSGKEKRWWFNISWF